MWLRQVVIFVFLCMFSNIWLVVVVQVGSCVLGLKLVLISCVVVMWVIQMILLLLSSEKLVDFCNCCVKCCRKGIIVCGMWVDFRQDWFRFKRCGMSQNFLLFEVVMLVCISVSRQWCVVLWVRFMCLVILLVVSCGDLLVKVVMMLKFFINFLIRFCFWMFSFIGCWLIIVKKVQK